MSLGIYWSISCINFGGQQLFRDSNPPQYLDTFVVLTCYIHSIFFNGTEIMDMFLLLEIVGFARDFFYFFKKIVFSDFWKKIFSKLFFQESENIFFKISEKIFSEIWKKMFSDSWKKSFGNKFFQKSEKNIFSETWKKSFQKSFFSSFWFFFKFLIFFRNLEKISDFLKKYSDFFRFSKKMFFGPHDVPTMRSVQSRREGGTVIRSNARATANWIPAAGVTGADGNVPVEC